MGYPQDDRDSAAEFLMGTVAILLIVWTIVAIILIFR